MVAHRRQLLMVAVAFAVLVPFLAGHLVMLYEPGSHDESNHDTLHAATAAQHSGHFEHSTNTDDQPSHADQHVLTEAGHALPRSDGTLDGLAALGALAVAVSVITWAGPCILRGSPLAHERIRRRTGRTLLLDLCIARS